MDEWNRLTHLGNNFAFFPQDRKKLVPIDRALAVWLAEPGGPGQVSAAAAAAPPAAMTEHSKGLLEAVYVACDKWLQDKGAKTSDNAVRRRIAVQKLRDQAKARLAYVRVPAYRAAYDEFERNKAAKQAGAYVPPTISLSQGYTREHYGKGKGAPRVGATNMGQAMANIKDKSVQEEITKITHGTDDLKKLSFEQYDALEAYLLKLKGTVYKNRDGEVVCEIRALTYYSKTQRLGHMMVPQNNRFFDLTGQPFSTRDAPDGSKMYIYAIDEYGNFYAEPGVAGLLHHSSFNRGKGVICAGVIQVANGLPYYISNESGHYKPSTVNLRNAVQLIHINYRIPTDNMWVIDMTQSQNPSKIHFPNGAAFLANQGSAICPKKINMGNPAMP